MTLGEMKALLNQKNPDAPLVFSTATETIGAGYHVTELKACDITSIDCGGNVSRWTEAALQLLDGAHGDYMVVGRFLGILNHSFATIEQLEASQAFVEFAPNNEGLRKFQPSYQETGPEIAQFRLIDARAQCKPSLSGRCGPAEVKHTPSDEAGCCGGPAPEGVDACCVKDADAKADGQSGCGCGDATRNAKAVSEETCCA
ncbi:MAG: DUF6428 family protein [Stappiaceae bacterium]